LSCCRTFLRLGHQYTYDSFTDPAPMAPSGGTNLTQARSGVFKPPSSSPASNSKASLSARNIVAPAVPSVQQSAGISQLHLTQSFQSPSSQGSVTRVSPPLPSGNGANSDVIMVRCGFGSDAAPPCLSWGVVDNTGNDRNGREGLPRIVKNIGLGGVNSGGTSVLVQAAPTQASYLANIDSGIQERTSGLNKGGNVNGAPIAARNRCSTFVTTDAQGYV
jgi:hypothetical protein